MPYPQYFMYAMLFGPNIYFVNQLAYLSRTLESLDLHILSHRIPDRTF